MNELNSCMLACLYGFISFINLHSVLCTFLPFFSPDVFCVGEPLGVGDATRTMVL